MILKNIKVGPLETNCYILIKGNKCLIIDPGDYEKEIIKELDGLEVIGIIVTHYHFDHIGALEEVKDFTGAKVYDFHNLNVGKNVIEDFEFEVIHTPGHKEDLICIYFALEKKMFVGDFIFEGSIGRCDLEGGSIDEMKKSIKKILTYPLDITLYPGHGDITTLKDEKENLEYYAKYF